MPAAVVPTATSLDLHSSPPTPPSPNADASRDLGTSLDLDLTSPPPAPAPSPAQSTSLDLEPHAVPTRAAADTPRAPRTRPQYLADTIHGRDRRILTAHRPTVTLNRLQSAIGTLTFEAACPAGVEQVRLGCLYQLTSGWSSTVQRADGNREGPRHSARPVILAHREQFEQLSVDLRQADTLHRLTAFLYSPSDSPVPTAGTFIVNTFGGASIEVSLELAASARCLAVMSLYNIDGEFVLRAEMEPIAGAVRAIGKAYGYDQITWIDDRTPTD